MCLRCCGRGGGDTEGHDFFISFIPSSLLGSLMKLQSMQSPLGCTLYPIFSYSIKCLFRNVNLNVDNFRKLDVNVGIETECFLLVPWISHSIDSRLGMRKFLLKKTMRETW